MLKFVLGLCFALCFTVSVFAQKGTTSQEVAAAKLETFNAYNTYLDKWSACVVLKNVAVSNIDAAILDLQNKIAIKPNFANDGNYFINQLNNLKSQINSTHSDFIDEMTTPNEQHENFLYVESNWHIDFKYVIGLVLKSFSQSIDLIYNAAYNQGTGVSTTAAQRFEIVSNNIAAQSKINAGKAVVEFYLSLLQGLSDEVDDVVDCYTASYPNF